MRWGKIAFSFEKIHLCAVNYVVDSSIGEISSVRNRVEYQMIAMHQ